MRLSLGEIRANAIAFAHDWADASSERAEAQSFWNDFFKVFGIPRRSVASFEEKVRNLAGSFDRIDVFYTGVMLGEHKSRGEDLSRAASQAFDYVQSLTREGRADETPEPRPSGSGSPSILRRFGYTMRRHARTPRG